MNSSMHLFMVSNTTGKGESSYTRSRYDVRFPFYLVWLSREWINKFPILTLPPYVDPYHGPGQAHGKDSMFICCYVIIFIPFILSGLCFSVMKGVTVPPSLRNVSEQPKRGFARSDSSGRSRSWLLALPIGRPKLNISPPLDICGDQGRISWLQGTKPRVGFAFQIR